MRRDGVTATIDSVPFEWSADIDQATWWTDVLHPFAQDVGSVIPDLFPAYARLFHPVDEQHGGPRTWAEITRLGRGALGAQMAAMKEIVERYESAQAARAASAGS